MAIITLTTDFGTKDHYIGMIKGAILSRKEDVTIIDISHDIQPYDLFQTAFIIRNCYKSFPEGTIHIIGVDTLEQKDPRYLVTVKEKQYFISSDNGVFSLLFDDKPDEVYELKLTDKQKHSTFPIKDVFVDIACMIADNKDISTVATPTDKIEEKLFLMPVLKENLIQGNIVYIDNYHNAFVNITRGLVDEVGRGRPLQVYYHKKESVNKIYESYREVPESEIVCLFGATGYLEIAINKDKASSLLGLEIGDPIQIEFL